MSCHFMSCHVTPICFVSVVGIAYCLRWEWILYFLSIIPRNLSGYPTERCFLCIYFALSVCNSVTYPGSSQVFNSGFACGWKRQDSSIIIVTSGEFKDYYLRLSKDRHSSIGHGETDLEETAVRAWSWFPTSVSWWEDLKAYLHSLLCRYGLKPDQKPERTSLYCLCF